MSFSFFKQSRPKTPQELVKAIKDSLMAIDSITAAEVKALEKVESCYSGVWSSKTFSVEMWLEFVVGSLIFCFQFKVNWLTTQYYPSFLVNLDQQELLLSFPFFLHIFIYCFDLHEHFVILPFNKGGHLLHIIYYMTKIRISFYVARRCLTWYWREKTTHRCPISINCRSKLSYLMLLN